MFDAMFGADPTPPATAEEREQLRVLRAKRAVVWLLYLGCIPAVALGSRWLSVDTLAPAWIIAIAVAQSWYVTSRCPRCGKRLLSWRFRLWSARCVHCAFAFLRPPTRRGR